MTARQLAVQLLFSMEINQLSPDEVFALFTIFSPTSSTKANNHAKSNPGAMRFGVRLLFRKNIFIIL